jgi:hypothetical protein
MPLLLIKATKLHIYLEFLVYIPNIVVILSMPILWTVIDGTFTSLYFYIYLHLHLHFQIK